MNQHQYKDLTIEVLDEPTYDYGSTDNNFNYSKPYFGEDAEVHPVSKHGVKIYRNDRIIDSCIIIGAGGATGINKNSTLLDNDQLLICCCDTVFCLTLPDLKLNWKTKADWSTCFQLFKLQDDYLIHGECEITRIDKYGKIKWQFSGADIFVSMDEEEEFRLAEDHIMLTDFEKTKYKIDFDGKLLWDTYQRKAKTTGNSTLPKKWLTWLQKLFGY
jgi:hypothetical protein